MSQKEATTRKSATMGSLVQRSPWIAREGLRSPGRALEPADHRLMGDLFAHDFSHVRVHTDSSAARAASGLGANAYSLDAEIAFAANRYSPSTSPGRRLLAHELAHVVQQERGGSNSAVEDRADAAAEKVLRAERIQSEDLGGAPAAYYPKNGDDKPGETTPKPQRKLTLNWPELPPLLQPQPRKPIFGDGFVPPFPKPQSQSLALLPPDQKPSGLPRPIQPLVPAKPDSGGDLPSRLSLFDRGQFSMGVRLDFPELEVKKIEGFPDLEASLRRAEILQQSLISGKVPTVWDTLDKGKLAKALWGIFSTNIAPDFARSLTSKLTRPSKSGKISSQLDLVILSDLSGGGISFLVNF